MGNVSSFFTVFNEFLHFAYIVRGVIGESAIQKQKS